MHFRAALRTSRRSCGLQNVRHSIPTPRAMSSATASTSPGAASATGSADGNDQYDYIVVGGGTAACVVASRLSEHAHVRVLVLERGQDPRNDPTVAPPTFNHVLPVIPEPFLPVETLHVGPDPNLAAYQRGFSVEYAARAWGGGPAVSGSFWGRGNPQNYDEWEALLRGTATHDALNGTKPTAAGAASAASAAAKTAPNSASSTSAAGFSGGFGWDYKSLLPFFKITENFAHPFHPETPVHADRGTAGLIVCGAVDRAEPAVQPFVKALSSAFGDAPVVLDASTSSGQYGLSPMVRSMGHDVNNPVRSTTFSTYLAPVLDARKNLTAVSNATVMRVVFAPRAAGATVQPTPPPRAVGVEYLVNGRARTAYAAKEVVLSAGAINTPKLLLQSGVGPAEELKAAGVECVADVPGVGRNITNHMYVWWHAQVSRKVMPEALAAPTGAHIAFLHSADFHKPTSAAATSAADAKAPAAAEQKLKADAAATPTATATAAPAAAAANKVVDTEIAWGLLPTPFASTPNRVFGMAINLRNAWRGTVSLRGADPLLAPSLRYHTPAAATTFVAPPAPPNAQVMYPPPYGATPLPYAAAAGAAAISAIATATGKPAPFPVRAGVSQLGAAPSFPSLIGVPSGATQGFDPKCDDFNKIMSTLRGVRRWLFDSGLCDADAPDNGPANAEVPTARDADTDALWRAWMLTRLRGFYHWGSSCRMGPAADPEAVVDADLRVRGVTGLRIADCSIQPLTVSSHPSATAAMIGERAAYAMQGWAPRADPKLNPNANSNLNTANATATAATSEPVSPTHKTPDFSHSTNSYSSAHSNGARCDA